MLQKQIMLRMKHILSFTVQCLGTAGKWYSAALMIFFEPFITRSGILWPSGSNTDPVTSFFMSKQWKFFKKIMDPVAKFISDPDPTLTFYGH
jgi:hypothetical protein